MGVTVKRTVHIPVSQIVVESARNATLAVAKEGAGQAAALAPVKDGALKGSIDAQSTGRDTAIYGTNIEYGIYQEFGTSKMRAQPFLRPSADWLRAKAANIYAKVLKGALRSG
jgi:HK97 gp10 family phage protein